MVFVVTPRGLLCTWGCELLNEKFSCIGDHSGVRVFFERKLSNLFTVANLHCQLS